LKLDNLGLLVREKYNEGHPANSGDSCAETSRLALIRRVLDLDRGDLDLSKFITDDGIVRYPGSIWNDISNDQKLPLYLYLKATNSPLLAKYKYHDMLWPLKNLVGINTFGQSFIFKNINYRWDDGKQSFQLASESSCDYLNFLAQIFYAHITGNKNYLIRKAMKSVTADNAMIKVYDYYIGGKDSEPNSEWLVILYNDAIRKVWGCE
jgi:hypothetical protein